MFDGAGIFENSVGEGALSVVNVGDYAEVSDAFYGDISQVEFLDWIGLGGVFS